MNHTFYDCPGDHDHGSCVFCDGGLTYCVVCLGAEASLPTHCPGRKMTADELDLVQGQKLDYINGEWR